MKAMNLNETQFFTALLDSHLTVMRLQEAATALQEKRSMRDLVLNNQEEMMKQLIDLEDMTADLAGSVTES